MVRYTKSSIQALRDQTDIVDIIGKYVPLKRAGASYKGRCPFHDENTPSFTVHKASGHYHCFGCGAHGDAISFLMQHERMEFTQAVSFLAEKVGVTLVPEEDLSPSEREEETKKARLKACNQEAMLFFHALLLNSPLAHDAREYLHSRHISLEFIRSFSIGYAPQEPLLTAYLSKKGFSKHEMNDVGLLAQGGRREFFFDRILFPILDTRGSVLGFSGRRFHEGSTGGKYINTPETPLFKKNRILFGISYAKRQISKERMAILVEGQLDALQLIFSGFQTAVATLGTACGEAHVEILRNLGVEQVYLAFDQDEAGFASAQKAGQLFLQKGVDVKVVHFQGAKDPDELLQKGGPLRFFDALLASKGYIEFLIEQAKKKSDFSSPAEKRMQVELIRARILEWDNPILRHEALVKLASLTSIPLKLLQEGAAAFQETDVHEIQKVKEKKDSSDNLEAELLRWLFYSLENNAEIQSLVREKFSKEEFQSHLFQRMFQILVDLLADKKPIVLVSLLEEFDTEELGGYKELFSEHVVRLDRAPHAVKELMNKLKERNWRIAREEVRERMMTGVSVDEEQSLALAKELAKLGSRPPTVS